MSYRYITIGARIAPLELVLNPAHARAVQAEMTLAESAPAMLSVLRSIKNLLDSSQRVSLADREVMRVWVGDAIDKVEGSK